jgi:hypothetical protein
MNLDIFGMLVLIVSLVLTVALQAGVMLGIMWILHKVAGEKMPDSNYGEFDFDNLQKRTLIELLVKLIVLLAPATFILHLFVFLFCSFSVRLHPSVWGFTLLLLEGGAIAAGLFYVLKLDRFRIIVLAGGSALFYIIYYALFLRGVLS